jgi:hypothetical protein
LRPAFPAFPLILLAAAGSLVLWFGASVWGIGLSPDSVAYVSAAREFAQGHGFTLGYNATLPPMTHWPPLYPLVLSSFIRLGMDAPEGARVLNVVLFGVNIGVFGLLAAHYTGSAKMALWTAFLFLSSRCMLEVHSYAHSEALFMIPALATIDRLGRFVEGRAGRPSFWAACGMSALASLDRYVGVSLIFWGACLLLAFYRANLFRRLGLALLYGLASGLPLALWMLRNFTLTSNLLDRTLAFHLPSRDQSLYGLQTVASWLVPEPFPKILQFAALGAVLILFAGIELRYRVVREKRQALWLLSFMLCYALVFAGYLTLLSVNTLPVSRHLSPLFFTGLLLAAVVLHTVWEKTPPQNRIVRPVILFVAMVFSLSYAARSVKWIREFREQGLGYAAKSWRLSPTVERLKELGEEYRVLFSNNAEAVYILTGRACYAIPRKFDRSSVRKTKPTLPRPDYQRDVAAMKGLLEKGPGLVVYFDLESRRMARWFYPQENELAVELGLELMAKRADGSIYQAK